MDKETKTVGTEIPDYWGMFFSIWQSHLNLWKIWAEFYSFKTPAKEVKT